LLFTVPALLGTAVFLVRLGLMTIVGLDHDVDVPHDVDIPHDVAIDAQGDVDLGHDVESGDSTEAFKLLSIQSVAAFLMGFGWGGVGGLLGFEWSFPMSLLVGVGFGLVLVWLLGILMKAMYDLQSSGNVRVEDAVGTEGATAGGARCGWSSATGPEFTTRSPTAMRSRPDRGSVSSG
jgi:hypothetical protein